MCWSWLKIEASSHVQMLSIECRCRSSWRVKLGWGAKLAGVASFLTCKSLTVSTAHANYLHTACKAQHMPLFLQ